MADPVSRVKISPVAVQTVVSSSYRSRPGAASTGPAGWSLKTRPGGNQAYKSVPCHQNSCDTNRGQIHVLEAADYIQSVA